MSERSIIERVARALCRNAGNPENIRFEGAPMWASYVGEARLAIIAMREPTEAMLAAGRCTSEQWARMIGAALDE